MTTADHGQTDVYQSHRDKILGNYKHPQGHYINQMKEYASTEIPNVDAISMNCSLFSDFIYTCNYIGVKEDIKLDRVYPALRLIGYNKCYHEYKLNGTDIFSDIHTLVNKCMLSFDYDDMKFASESRPFFDDVKTKVYRVNKSVAAVVVTRAKQCGIRTSDLNLYHALQGLKLLVENDIEYIEICNKEIVADSLIRLVKADKSLLKFKSRLGAEI